MSKRWIGFLILLFTATLSHPMYLSVKLDGCNKSKMKNEKMIIDILLKHSILNREKVTVSYVENDVIFSDSTKEYIYLRLNRETGSADLQVRSKRHDYPLDLLEEIYSYLDACSYTLLHTEIIND